MPAKILDGTKIASDIRAEAAQQVESLNAAGQRPGLAVILAGHNPASEIYVRNKVKACQQLGIHSEKLTPPDSVTTEELLQMVNALNQRDEIDGILVQLPLPRQVDSKKVLLAEFEHFFGGDAAREKSFTEKGSTLVGDVNPNVADVAGAITPVPGGVGPLTIAMLMVNTINACKMRRGRGK